MRRAASSIRAIGTAPDSTQPREVARAKCIVERHLEVLAGAAIAGLASRRPNMKSVSTKPAKPHALA